MKKVFKGERSIFFICAGVFLLLFIPVLLAVIIGGNNFDYEPNNKIETFFSNPVLLLFGIPVFILICLIVRWGDRIRISDNKKGFFVVAGLLAVYALWYVVNLKICKMIVYGSGWDVSVVTGTVYQLWDNGKVGTDTYYSIYPNNIPILWLLHRIYEKAYSLQNYPYFPEFLWIQILCVMESVTGVVLGIAAYIATKKAVPVIISGFLFLAICGVSPWTIIPYTDSFTILFPILVICLYIIYTKTESSLKYILIPFIEILGIAGGILKVTNYIVLFAIVIVEIARCFFDIKKRWKALIVIALLCVGMFFSQKMMNDKFIKETGAEINDTVSVGWQHYFYMGLMEGSTGSYNPHASAILGDYETRRERQKDELRLAGEIIKGRTFSQNANFALRKMVMTYNDGSFSWNCEGAMRKTEYRSISESRLKPAMKDFFWGGGKNLKVFLTYSQWIWIFMLVGIPGALFAGSDLIKQKKDNALWLAAAFLSLLGIFLFLLLFETRARYLISFLPLYILISTLGYQKMAERVVDALKKRTRRR